MKKRIILSMIVILASGLLLILLLNKNREAKNIAPIITLVGDSKMIIEEKERFKDPGYKASDKNDGDLTDNVQIEGYVDTDHAGVYEIKYTVTNSNNKKTESKRIVEVKKSTKEYRDEYDGIDNTIRSWGTNNKKDGSRPILELSNEELKNLGAYAMGPDEKTLYLTFDEGSMDTYLDEIVEILDKNNVKGTFFLCKNYIKNNPELMKSMLKSGHSIGNHTASHPSMPSLATKENFTKYIKELKDTELVFEEITGTKLDPVYREPRGEYSIRSLSIIKDLGYKTYFWSAAYKDWDDSLTKEEALKKMVERVHPGAIYLLHSVSKGNYLALDDFINQMQKEGYKFDLVKNIP